MKNFRVYYQINGRQYRKDFSKDGVIDIETMNISAWHEIKKSHSSIKQEDLIIIKIE